MKWFSCILVCIASFVRAQEPYRCADFHFPPTTQKVVKTESEINRVTGEKKEIKKVTYFFEKQRLQKRITLENEQEITELFQYNDSVLIGYTKNYPDIKSEEKYHYSKTGKLQKILLLDDGKITAQIQLTYDKNGNLSQKLTFADDKTLVRKETFSAYTSPSTYTQKVWVKEGKKWLVDEVYQFENGNLMRSTHNKLGEPYTLIKTYDTHHNILKDEKFETQDPVLYHTKYDDQGRMLSVSIVSNDAVYYVGVEYDYQPLLTKN
ncbi:MAG: hypothetical protein RLZZ500_1185 [Bacteroidota bacterium]|jgi:antitoxin component YwqK of YwqJK toxin-antitoxin module